MEPSNTMSDGYRETRLAYDCRRARVWQSLWKYYFSRQVRADDSVLDLGCGYGDFINNVVARRRIAIDLWPGFVRHVAKDVEAIVGSVTDLDVLPDASVDFAFASNLLEHLLQPDIVRMLAGLTRKLKNGGTLTVIQPNWRYACREYFDDYTHVSFWSHVSLVDFLHTNGWQVLEVEPRFLPLTIKSRLPVHPWIIRAWLISPFKPIGKQMLIKARPRAYLSEAAT
jgi:ubiquinone/menaquinone biosynthesis C-methylase UbiE